MRSFALLALSVLPAFAATLEIDHVTVAGPRVEDLRKAFTTAAHVPTEYGGKHANHATEMALTSFPDGSYFEFMGIQADAAPKAVSGHVWGKFLRGNTGPCAFALRVADVSVEAAKLQVAGVSVKSPEHSGRTRPDGTRLEWETSDVGAGGRGTFFPFLIHDITPRSNRVYPSGKPTTTRFQGIARVVIGVPDLDKAIAEYRRAFTLTAPLRQSDKQFGAELAWFEDTPIVLAQGQSSDSWLARRVQKYGSGPCAFILALKSGMMGNPSRWFGRSVFWMDEAQLGWRLGAF